jgi:CheY-like chemotaxis protein
MAQQSKTVLVVDDDIDLAKMVELLLTTAGYEVILAEDGQSALDQLAKQWPSLILLDMKMPGMDGWEFAREFHSKYDRSLPIIVFTAAEDAKKRAQEIGANDYLGKPFEIDDLITMVERYTTQPASKNA